MHLSLTQMLCGTLQCIDVATTGAETPGRGALVTHQLLQVRTQAVQPFTTAGAERNGR